MSTKRPLFLLLLILLLAFGLRIVNIDTFGFWTDEGLTPLRSGYSVAEILSNRVTIQQGVGRDTHPPLYYLLIHFTQKGLGQTDFAYRYPSFLAGVLLIPVMYQLGRRLRGRHVGLLAAFLTAVNPLQIYYGNEARMYTLYVLLSATMTYLLWRALSGGSLRRYLLLYLLVAGLTIYTHYTAVFLIAAQSVFWLWLLWQHGQKRLIAGMAVVGVLAAIPLIPYTIPRLFTGAEANYVYIPPLVMLQDVVHGFILGKTMGDPWGWPAGIFNTITLLFLAISLWSLRQRWQKAALLLTYLLAIVFGLMLGSLLKPMYQGVRHTMGGSPAILLLLAIGLVWLWQQLSQTNQTRRYLQAVANPLLILLLLAGPAVSLNNFYNNPEYIKDDYRGMIAYIEQQAGDNDLVIYNDAVLLPLHEHYRTRTNLNVTALPVYPYAAGNVADPLTRFASEYSRIWFVADPPNDGRDDGQKVLAWLDEELLVFDKRWFPARTTEIIALGYTTAGEAADALPRYGRLLEPEWLQFPQLVGVALATAQPVAQPALWFNLFWDGELTNPEATLRFSLRGPDGQVWLLQEQLIQPTAGVWPTAANQLIRRSHRLTLPDGFPPGDYMLVAQPLDKENGAALADTIDLLQVPVAATSTWPFEEKRPFFDPPALAFTNGVNLRQLEMLDLEVRPGHNLPFDMVWETEAADLATENLRYMLEIVADDGTIIHEQSNRLGASWLTEWPLDTTIQQRSGIYIRPQIEPGTYQMRWRLQAGDAPVDGRTAWSPWTQEVVDFGHVEVVPWPLETTLPPIANARQANFSEAIQLHGYDLTDLTADSLDLTLYWEATAVPPANYLLFAHLISAASGEIVSQKDVIPVSGLRPTKGWRKGEILLDSHQLPLPADLASGNYYLNIGFYDPSTSERLPVLVDAAPQPHNQLQLTTINLP